LVVFWCDETKIWKFCVVRILMILLVEFLILLALNVCSNVLLWNC